MSDGLDLAAALSALPGKKTSTYPRCSASMVMADLAVKDPAAHVQLADVLERQDVEAVALSSVLSQYGYDVKAHTIRRHRRRGEGAGCSCPVAT